VASLVISAKNLGAFAIERACRRCLWVQLHVKNLPYQIFPGIFSTIDAYNKRVVHSYFDREGCMPSWLGALGGVVGYVEPPSYHKFTFDDPATGVTIRGTPDGVFRMGDGSYTIVDYKTAKFTPGQGRLLPVYRAQLNGYAYLGDRLGLGPVTQIALVYMEPVTDGDTAASPRVVDDKGFNMALSATVVPVKLNPDGLIPRLMARAREIYDLPSPPEPAEVCRDCKGVQTLANFLG
jgi:hypothetical protein